MWDDYISVINPEMHKKFCVPCNKRIFEKYGRGHLHTCGPYFPKFIDACLACEPRSMDIGIMRGMNQTKDDLLAFLDITVENNIRLLGNLKVSEKNSIFDDSWVKIDNAFLETFVRGGWMPTGEGSYEEGLIFKKTIESIEL